VPLGALELAQPGRGELAAVVGGLVDLGGGGLALVDRLGQDDLLLRGQERHLADLLEVHADGVVGGGLEGQLLVAGRAGLAGELLGIELVDHLDDLDVLVLQVLQDVVHLLGRDVDRGEGLDDLLVGEEAPLFALGDEVSDLVDLRLLGDGHLLRYLSFRTAPGGCAGSPPRRCARGDPRRLRAAAPAGLAVAPRGR
jgi:hypothetical protein